MTIPSTDEAARIIERATGGTVVNIQRQLRWRPTWFADVESDGETRGMVLRGDRTDSEAFPLHHEYTFHRLLEEHGLPVPHLYGFIETPGCIDFVLMAKVPGQAEFQHTSDDDRNQVVDEYVQQLAVLHQLDPQPFIDAGIDHPHPGEDPAMAGHRHMISRFRDRKVRPDPFSEFCIGWHERHLPQANGRMAPGVWDSGQFMHQNGHLVAIIDLEFGHVGDPLEDLTIWRMRDTLLHFGDFAKIYARYEQFTGTPIDLEAIKRHHFAACMGNGLQFGAAWRDPLPETDVMNIMQWSSETNLMATDFLGEYLGLDLPTLQAPDASETRHDAVARQLVRSLGSVKVDDREAQHELRLAFRMARHLQRRSEIGAALDEADIADVAALLGRRPADWFAAERELEQFVLTDAGIGKYDEPLTILFHQRNQRLHMALGAPGSTMVRHYQCQRFDGAPAYVVQF
ncbi:MAG: phosphotransferase [Actinomycetota bacterium]|nr:phosphotransferase [Actinomycetota bacterium]